MGWVALYFAGRILELGISEWIEVLSAPMVAGLLMGAGVLATQQALATVVGENVFVLALLIVEGVILYVVAMRLLAPARWEEFVTELTAIVPLKPIRWLSLRTAHASPPDQKPLPAERGIREPETTSEGDREVSTPTLRPAGRATAHPPHGPNRPDCCAGAAYAQRRGTALFVANADIGPGGHRPRWPAPAPSPSRRANRRWADVDGVEITGRAISGRRERL